MSVVAAVLLLLGVAAVVGSVAGSFRPSRRRPAAFLRAPRPPGPVVVFLGASNTQANLAVDWVGEVAAALGPEVGVVNAGIGGYTAALVRRALPDALACRPDLAVVQIGGNDVRAGVSPAAFREELAAIVDALRAGGVRGIALCTLCTVGDEVGSRANLAARGHSAVVRELAAARGVDCLDVHAAMEALLDADPRRPGLLVRVPALGLLPAMVERQALRLSFERIVRLHGGILTTDGIHVGPAAAAAMRDLALGWLRPRVPSSTR